MEKPRTRELEKLGATWRCRSCRTDLQVGLREFSIFWSAIFSSSRFSRVLDFYLCLIISPFRMSDPARTDLPAADALAGHQRDARVEQLLLTGLDHYFAGRYERAIHVWTRVLFLERGHPRACAYIDRARSALAERQRESEELLHRGTAAFDGGEVTDARRLLTAAVE